MVTSLLLLNHLSPVTFCCWSQKPPVDCLMWSQIYSIDQKQLSRLFGDLQELLHANVCVEAYKAAAAAVQRHIKEMRAQAQPLCAPRRRKGGFRGLADRPQGTDKMNEVKRCRGWGLFHGGLR